MTDVDPQLYYDAAAAYKEDSDAIAGSLRTLTAALVTPNASGTHPAGKRFATAYDSTADHLGVVGTGMVNLMHNIGNLLQQTGVNHEQGEEASTLNRQDADGDPITPPGDTEGTFLTATVDVPSVSGGNKPTPLGWDLVDKRVTDGWPNGSPDVLRAASTAWATFGRNIVAANAFESPEEIALIVGVKSKEIDAAADKMNRSRLLVADVSGAAGDLSRSSKEYADKLQFVQESMTRTLALLSAMVAIPMRWPPILRRAADPLIASAIETAVAHCNKLNTALSTTADRVIGDLKIADTQLGRAQKKAEDLLALTPRQVAATPAAQVRENQRRGARAEERAGLTPGAKKERIYPFPNDPSRKNKYRIPDELKPSPTDDNPPPGEKVLTEVKNVNTLSATRQIKEMALWARDHGYSMVIVVDNRTEIGTVLPRLQQEYPGLKVSIVKKALQ